MKLYSIYQKHFYHCIYLYVFVISRFALARRGSAESRSPLFDFWGNGRVDASEAKQAVCCGKQRFACPILGRRVIYLAPVSLHQIFLKVFSFFITSLELITAR